MMILFMLGVPLAGLVLSTLCARRSEARRDKVYLAETLAVFALVRAKKKRDELSARDGHPDDRHESE